jgi:hypothetical protein
MKITTARRLSVEISFAGVTLCLTAMAHAQAPKSAEVGGGLRVALSNVCIGPITLKSATEKPSDTKEDFLCVRVILSSSPESTSKESYSTWAPCSPAMMVLKKDQTAKISDNFGNQYNHLPLCISGYEPLGHIEYARIDPGSTVTDLLIIEKPIAKAQFLILTLPLKNLGRDGDVQFKIHLAEVPGSAMFDKKGPDRKEFISDKQWSKSKFRAKLSVAFEKLDKKKANQYRVTVTNKNDDAATDLVVELMGDEGPLYGKWVERLGPHRKLKFTVTVPGDKPPSKAWIKTFKIEDRDGD